MAEEKLICPLILATIPTKPDLSNCRLNKCMWFYHLEGQPEERGFCSINRIGFELSRLRKELDTLRGILLQQK